MAAGELKSIMVEIAATVRDALAESGVTMLLPGQTVAPEDLAERVEIEGLDLGSGAGRAGARDERLAITMWACAKRTTNKARALEIANLVADAVEGEDVECSGGWVIFDRPALRTLAGELDILQVEIVAEGHYVRP